MYVQTFSTHCFYNDHVNSSEEGSERIVRIKKVVYNVCKVILRSPSSCESGHEKNA